MAISVQLVLVLVTIATSLFILLSRCKSVAFLCVSFIILLFVPAEAIGLFSGSSYNTSGIINVSLVGYSVIISFIIYLLVYRASFPRKIFNEMVFVLVALFCIFILRFIVDGANAFSNKILDNYLLPAFFAFLIILLLRKEEVPQVLRCVYYCVLINAIIADVEFFIGRSLFFHEYYLTNTTWYSNVYYSSAYVSFRSTALSGHPLTGGIYYILALIYLLNHAKIKKKIAFICQCLFILFAIFTTNSRGVMLISLIYIVYYIIKCKKIRYYLIFGGIVLFIFDVPDIATGLLIDNHV